MTKIKHVRRRRTKPNTMSKVIDFSPPPLRHREGGINYSLGAAGGKVSLKLSVSDPMEADFVGISIGMQVLARVIKANEGAENLAEETEQALDAYRLSYAALQGLHQEVAKGILDSFDEPKLIT